MACAGAGGDVSMEEAAEDVDQQQADKFLRLQQAVSSGDAAELGVLLSEGPALDKDDVLTLWFDVLRTHRSPSTVELLRCLVEQGGVDPSEIDGDSMSALHLACSSCMYECVEYLLSLPCTAVNEADVFGMLPLHHAISMCKTQVALEGELEGLRSSSDSLRTSSDWSITQNDLPTAEAVVTLLLDNGAQVNLVDCCSSSKPPSYTTPLCFAVDIGNVRVVEMLLKAGALVNPSLQGRGDGSCPKKCPPLQCALDTGDLMLAGLLINHGARCDVKLKDESYLIHHYCRQGNLPAVQFLLDHNVSISQQGGPRKHSPLQVAATHGHANIMELLLVRGAFLQVPHNPVLLSLAIMSGDVASVQLLIDHGVDVNSRGDHDIPALYLACSKSAHMVNTLLSAGADPNAGGERHKPVCNVLPLHRRPAADTVDIVHSLIRYNADVNVLSREYMSQQNLTLLQRALLSGENNVVSLLLRSALVHKNNITDGMINTFRSKAPPHAAGLVQILQYHQHNPYRLAQLSRSVIRRHTPFIYHIRHLPLPQPILDYLILTELDENV